MAVELSAKVRQERGTRSMRRLRSAGQIPAVLYGHGQETVSLAIQAELVQQVVQQGSKLVELRGELNESALIREVQWDPFGTEVLHLDLFRVTAGERVETTIAIHLRGEAAGLKSGGVVEHVLHEVDIECPVSSLPDRLELNINALGLGESLYARDLPLPEGAKLLIDEDLVVVHCVQPAHEEDEELAAAAPGEPEVIGRKAGEDEEGDEE